MILILEVVLESDTSMSIVPCNHALPSLIILKFRKVFIELSVGKTTAESDPLTVFVNSTGTILEPCEKLPNPLIELSLVFNVGAILLMMVFHCSFEFSWTSIEAIDPVILNKWHRRQQHRIVVSGSFLELPFLGVFRSS